MTSEAIATGEGRARASDPENERRSGQLLVHGGPKLHSGQIGLSGFKHSLVTVVAAAACGGGTVTVGNCPDIVESDVLAGLVRGFGGTARLEAGTLTVDCARLSDNTIPHEAAARIHGAVYLMPALLARTGSVSMPFGGGCQIGDDTARRRPTEQYVSVLGRFGAAVTADAAGGITATADRLRGCEIDLLDYTVDRRLMTGPLYSGATKVALLTAAVAHGTSLLRHPYPKPDVLDAVTVLTAMGADIETRPDGTIVVRGRGPGALDRPVRHTLVPDLIEIVTWICAGTTVVDGSLLLTGPDLPRALRALAPEMAVLEQLGVDCALTQAGLRVTARETLRPVEVTVASHGVFSDSQPFIALLAAHAAGRSRITETVWGNRFGYAEGLARLGVGARVEAGELLIDGPRPPRTPGRLVTGGDLRAAAVLLLAALAVPGPTRIRGVEHLARGYADLPGALRTLGASITAEGQGR